MLGLTGSLSLRSGMHDLHLSIPAHANLRSKMTDVYEGSLIRLFRRLEELLRQIAEAAKVMGSQDLAQKFEQSLLKVRRDIVAAQSLYLGD